METPMSARKVSRSQTLAAANDNISVSRNNEGSDKGLTKSRQRNDRWALIDISNDSPIVGVAMGGSLLETPVSSMVKQKSNWAKKTPGSGEALLRGQVKTLLQDVKEEYSVLSKFSSDQTGGPFLHLSGILNAPLGLLAPTPMNTPNVLNLMVDQCKNNAGSDSIAFSPPVIEEQMDVSQVVEDMVDGKVEEGSLESQTGVISRSLLLDFSGKSETSADSSDCPSVISYLEVGETEKREAPKFEGKHTRLVYNSDDEIEGQVEYEPVEEEYNNDHQDYDDDGRSIKELCEGLTQMTMNNEKRKVPKFEGRHTRFVYNSDDEIQGKEE